MEMRNPKTFFEQVPVEAVKKIAGIATRPKEQVDVHNLVVERPDTKTEPYSIKADLL